MNTPAREGMPELPEFVLTVTDEMVFAGMDAEAAERRKESDQAPREAIFRAMFSHPDFTAQMHAYAVAYAAALSQPAQGGGRHPCPRGDDCEGRDCPKCANFTPPPPSDAAQGVQAVRVDEALSRAYGYLWHVNHPEDIPIGHPYMSADRAATEARKELRDLLTSEQRGTGINWVRQMILAAHKGEGNG